MLNITYTVHSCSMALCKKFIQVDSCCGQVLTHNSCNDKLGRNSTDIVPYTIHKQIMLCSIIITSWTCVLTSPESMEL